MQFTGGRDVFAQQDRETDDTNQLSVEDLDLDNRLKRKYLIGLFISSDVIGQYEIPSSVWPSSNFRSFPTF